MARAGEKRAGRWAMTAAAAGVATAVTGVAATMPGSISASLVDLSALIVVGSSTNPSGAGVESFFGGKFADPVYTGPSGDDIVYVNFLTGPFGIQQALDANAGEPNLVLASGWGAANASLLVLGDRADLDQTVFILDNDVARPDGGFGTRYPWFALIGVNPIPTPSDVPASAAVNIGYQYDYNSNAPADVLNPIAAVNSLVGYLYTRLNQAEVDLPVNADGSPSVSCNANTCALTVGGAVLDCADARCSSPTDRITAYVTQRDNTTYVTYTVEELPLTRLIRDVFGDQLADLVGPLLKLAVDSAYYGGNPIPRDPSAYRPARLMPSPAELVATATKIPGAIQEGLAAISSPPPPTTPPEATTTAVTATRTGANDDDSDAQSRPQLDLVRTSAKAVPGEIAIIDPDERSDLAATEEDSSADLGAADSSSSTGADPTATDTDTDTATDPSTEAADSSDDASGTNTGDAAA
ncbi:PE-PPE domain-containing protein [Mycobacterium sp. IDR2000157661]|uniref:PE-PPE domain-containing protein n=1 Tax=Mycobacterium sp. IDR2000157661 TaxID=2867005 RepID=UPI001EEBBCD1|nr:PE-PPE domain-containing protein [Mycobacterium sp. IDR2000157661]ULE31839.1 PE-PPE domain-containing protein [Mycobacterium sp. IDR2000157661]